MNRFDRLFMHLCTLLVGGTGIVYAVMRYLVSPADEWSVVNHPWQPHVQHLHVVVAPLLVFAGGLFFRYHVLDKMRHNGPRGRASGLALAAQFIPMVLSGYMIQVSVSEAWRLIWIWVHGVTSGLWVMMALAHRFRAAGKPEGGADASPLA